MVQPTYMAALRELKTIPLPEHQLTLLRLLKNDIVGHNQRKEHVVTQGLLEPLAQILNATIRSTGKKASMETLHRPSLEDDIRLQATLIIGSLANGMTLSIHRYTISHLIFLAHQPDRYLYLLSLPPSFLKHCFMLLVRQQTPLPNYSSPR